MQSEDSLEIVLETIDAAEVVIVKSLVEAFRGAFRGTVFNPNGPLWFSSFPPSWRRCPAIAAPRKSARRRNLNQGELAEPTNPRLHVQNAGDEDELAVESAKNDSGEPTYRISA
jgi:hypothetical protein